MKSYQEEQIAFVSNLKGTSISTIVACLALAPLMVAYLKVFKKTLGSYLCLGSTTIAFPVLLSMTILADFNYELIFSLFAWLVLAMLFLAIRKKNVKFIKCSDSINSNKAFITFFRGSTCLFTCIAILAVDFKIFPRKFAKTEEFGIGLMDMGTGIFIISSALTSKAARVVSPPTHKRYQYFY